MLLMFLLWHAAISQPPTLGEKIESQKLNQWPRIYCNYYGVRLTCLLFLYPYIQLMF